jgi:hypothetical protein
VQELIPLLSGFAAGVVLGALRPSLRLAVGALLSVLLGVLATIVTGEFRTSWDFVLIDIPLVAVATMVGLAVAQQGARHRLRSG